jgi:hypothetical protein
VAVISNAQGSKGVAFGVAPGNALISATLFGVTGNATLTVQ